MTLSTSPMKWQAEAIKQANRCHGHRFPIDVVSRLVRLYFRFSLSCRDVELMIAERGITVSYETVQA